MSHQSQFDLNVLPEVYRRRWLSMRQMISLLAVAVTVILAVAAYLTASGAVTKTSDLRGEMTSLDLQMQLIQAQQQKLSQLKADAARYNAVHDMRGRVSNLLQVVALEATIADLQLSDLAINEESIIIGGTAVRGNDNEARNAVYAFVDDLRKKEGFSDTELSSPPSAGSQSGQQTFTITISLD